MTCVMLNKQADCSGRALETTHHSIDMELSSAALNFGLPGAFKDNAAMMVPSSA